MVHGKNRISYWIDRRLTGLAGPEYHAIISIGLPIKPEDSQYGESWLKGRRFYGVFDEGAGKYWACVRRREQDDPTRLGLRTGTIEGGLYASERLCGDYEALVTLIAPTFEAMAARHRVDSSRPAIEFYRRHDEFVLYLPIAELGGWLEGPRKSNR